MNHEAPGAYIARDGSLKRASITRPDGSVIAISYEPGDEQDAVSALIDLAAESDNDITWIDSTHLSMHIIFQASSGSLEAA
ncbi:MAG: hypothetical protein AAGB51_06935 [Planctomycetota bacterium]